MEELFRHLKSERRPEIGNRSFAEEEVVSYIGGLYSQHRLRRHNSALTANGTESKYFALAPSLMTIFYPYRYLSFPS